MTLGDAGHNAHAFATINQTTFPSYGCMLRGDGPKCAGANATTFWESWFFSDDTYSHNHPMFSSVAVWFVQSLAGIRPAADAYAFDRLVLAPRPPYFVRAPGGAPEAGLSHVNVTWDTARGPVASAWTLDAASGAFAWAVEVPPNAVAEVRVPGKPGGGTSVIGSGRYTFASTLTPVVLPLPAAG